MKAFEEAQERVCPRCGQTYREHPALSREDNETLICPDCGTREALASIGISAFETERIIEVLHRHSRAVSPTELQ